MGILFKQEYWSGLLCPPPGDLPDPGLETGSPATAEPYQHKLLPKFSLDSLPQLKPLVTGTHDRCFAA